MKATLHTSWRWSCRLTRLLVVLAAIVVVVAGATVSWLSHEPVSLMRALPYVQSYLSPYGLKLEAQDITLSFNRRFVLGFDDLKIKDEQNHVRLKVAQAQVSLANRRLVLGQLAPKHIEVEQAIAHIDVRHEGVFIGNMPLAKIGEEEANTPMPGVVEFLNDWSQHPYLRELRTVKLTNSHLLLRDRRTQVRWLVQDIGAQFSHYPAEGEHLTIAGKVRQKQVPKPMPFLVSAQHEEESQWLTASLKFEDSDTDLVKAYIPPALQEMLKSRGRIELGTRLGLQNKLEEPYFILRLDETQVFPEEAYTHPLLFNRVTLRGRYAAAPLDTLWIQELSVLDTAGNTIEASGKITGLEEDPQVDIRLQSDITTLDDVIYYMPDKAISATTEWLNKAISGTKLANLKATYIGKPSAMPFCGKQCGVTVQADILDGTVRFFEHAEPAHDISATFLLKEDYLNVSASHGQWALQQAKNVSVTLVGLFTPGESHLHVGGEAQGPLKPLLKELDAGLEEDEIPLAAGQQQGTFHISLPIYKGHKKADLHEIQMQVNSRLSNVIFPLEPLGGEELRSNAAQLKLNNRDLTFKGDGTFAGIPVNVDWQSNLEHPDSSAKLKLKAQVPAEKITPYTQGKITALEGTMPFEADIHQANEHTYTLTAKADLTPLKAELAELNWRKQADTELKGEVEGQLTLAGDKTAINLDLVSLTGPGVEIAGSVYVDGDHQVTAQFMPFRLGEQNLAVQWLPNRIELVGPQLDARGVDLMAKRAETTLPEKLAVRLAVEKVLLQHGNLTFVKVEAQREAGKWHQAQVEGMVQQKPFGLALIPLENGAQRLTLGAQNTGAVLATLANYTQIRDGLLEGTVYLAPNAKGDMVGDGMLTIQRARLVDIPIMAQLLALLSLEPLMDSSSGISFQTIKIPLKIAPDAIHTSGAEFSGASMDMQLKGFYSMDGQVNFDGRLIPAVGLNKTLAHLPLVGTLLAGSQDGVLVADFKIKGFVDDPKVSVKPLSLVTPGLLKDLFGGVFGGGD